MIEAAEPVEDKWGPMRARLVAGVLGLLFVVIVGRSAQVALSGEPGNVAHAGAPPAAIARRADILDRKGQLLATTVPAWSLSADPGAIWDAKEVAAGIASVLPGANVEDLTTKLGDKDRKFVAISRDLTPRQHDALFKLGLEGLRFQEEEVRLYPGGRLAGHLLGYINAQGKGRDGVERAFEDRLAKGGEPLKLTIDAGVQFALEAELDKAAEDFTMKGAAGVVIDASTGAVRAIASWPAVDPNHPGEGDEETRLDRAIGADYELGSIFKPLTVAAAIEANELKTGDRFDVSTPIRIGGATIHDSHTLDHAKAVNVADILAYSSNIGAVQIGQRVGISRLKAFLALDGLLGRPTYDGPASAYPILPSEWGALTSATVAFGQGISVSPLSFAVAFAPFANGGDYVDPVFLEPVDPAAVKRRKVMSAETAKLITGLMRQTVLVGTGKNADAPGYEVAGKTGTAEKINDDGGYDKTKNITSFAAVFPASRPQFVVLIVLDEAQPKSGDPHTAAYTSAAIAGRVIARSAPLLDVKPVLDKPAAAVDAQSELRTLPEARTP